MAAAKTPAARQRAAIAVRKKSADGDAKPKVARKPGTKKAPSGKAGAAAKHSSAAKSSSGAAAKKPSAAAARKNPKGGLTAAGRAHFKKTEGANLKPGVTKKGAAMSPDDMRRKGSFLRRHFANPRGPMVDDQGEPTRLALSAHAWGEPVPKTPAAAKKLAAKGEALLARYQKSKAGDAGKGKTRRRLPSEAPPPGPLRASARTAERAIRRKGQRP